MRVRCPLGAAQSLTFIVFGAIMRHHMKGYHMVLESVKEGDKFRTVQHFTADCVSYDGRTPPSGFMDVDVVVTVESVHADEIEFRRRGGSSIFCVKRDVFAKYVTPR